MNIIQQYLDENRITRYQVSKKSGISATTLQHAVERKNAIDGLTGKVIKSIAFALDRSPGKVLNDLIDMENSND